MVRSHVGSRFSDVVRSHVGSRDTGQSSFLSEAIPVRLEAGEGLGRSVPVYQRPNGKAYAASSGDATTREIIGLTAAPADAGELVSVVYRGEVSWSDWNWIPGLPVYVGLSGALVQTPPTSGQHLIVGHAVSSDTILLGAERYPRKVFTKNLTGMAVTIPSTESGISYPEIKVLKASGEAVSVVVAMSEASVQISSLVPLDNHIAVLTT